MFTLGRCYCLFMADVIAMVMTDVIVMFKADVIASCCVMADVIAMCVRQMLLPIIMWKMLNHICL